MKTKEVDAVNRLQALASWNFRHIVSVNPIRRIHEINIKGNYLFTLKAETELESDGLLIEDALESILNSEDIYKVLNSGNPKTGKKEKLYIIKSVTYDNILIYTKGKVVKESGQEQFYILISSKRAI